MVGGSELNAKPLPPSRLLGLSTYQRRGGGQAFTQQHLLFLGFLLLANQNFCLPNSSFFTAEFSVCF